LPNTIAKKGRKNKSFFGDAGVSVANALENLLGPR